MFKRINAQRCANPELASHFRLLGLIDFSRMTSREELRELTGWGEVAAYLGVSVRTAQMYESRLDLPVHRLPGPKGRIWANPTELDSWKANRPSVNTEADNSHEVRHGSAETAVTAATVLADSILSADQEPSGDPLSVSTRRSASWLLMGLLILVVALIGVGTLLALGARRGPPADFYVQGRDVVVIDRRGRELWRHSFQGKLTKDLYQGDARNRYSWLGDLGNDGHTELLFVFKPSNWNEVGSTLLCFAADGSVEWRFTPGRPVRDGAGDEMLPPFGINQLLVVQNRAPAKSETRIVVSSNHYLEQPDQVAFLDTQGKVMGEYWHPGHLLHMAQADLDGNGKVDVLLAGVNNGDHTATMVVLEPGKMSGITTPHEMQDPRFGLMDMPAAHEKAVILFPRSCLSQGQRYTRAKGLLVSPERIMVDVNESTSDTARDPGFFYEFDYKLNVVDVTAVGNEQPHLRDFLAGLQHPCDPDSEQERLKKAIVIRRSD